MNMFTESKKFEIYGFQTMVDIFIINERLTE